MVQCKANPVLPYGPDLPTHFSVDLVSVQVDPLYLAGVTPEEGQMSHLLCFPVGCSGSCFCPSPLVQGYFRIGLPGHVLTLS